MACWSYRPDERPEFSQMQNNLNKLPKKRLHRSPSHPIHLSRSAESVFWAWEEPSQRGEMLSTGLHFLLWIF